MHKRTFTGTIRKGHLQCDDVTAGLMRQHIAACGEGSRVSVTIGPAESKRSERANAYLWSVVYPTICADTGNSANDLHEFCCQKFLTDEPKQVQFWNRLTGEQVMVQWDGRRTSKLSGADFFRFTDQVIAWASQELGITVPAPDPDYMADRAKSERRAA